MKYLRIYTGEDGESHFEDIEYEMAPMGEFPGIYSKPWKTKAVVFRETDADYDIDFHNAPRRQFVINLKGSVEIEVGSGEKRVLGPGDILLAEDTGGRGHISRAVGEGIRESIFLPLEEQDGDSR